MFNTPHLNLAYLAPAQAQKHVTVNEGFAQLDSLVQCAAKELFRDAPPADAAEGDRYLIGSVPIGEWAGQAGRLATFLNGGWEFIAPKPGWRIYNLADDVLYVLNTGLVWVPLGASAGGGGEIQNAALFGLGTTADAANPFAARLNSALWTALLAADGGTGDLRLVVNKEAAAGIASVLFQSAFSGRAELGLMGSNAFAIRISGDGASFQTALSAHQGGVVSVGHDAAVALFGANVPSLQSHGPVPLGVARWSNDSAGPVTVASKSRSATVGQVGSPVQTNDSLGAWSWCADNGTFLDQAVAMNVVASGDWSSPAGRSAEFLLRTRNADVLGTRMFVRANGKVQLPSIATTASAGNAFLDAADQNAILRSTSSLQFKREVEDLEPVRADAVLSLRPIWYRSTAEADNPKWSWYGLGAEEVAAVDPRLVHWGYRDEDYEDRVVERDPETGADVVERALKPGAQLAPDGVQYDRLAVLLLDVVRRQEARIAALEAKLDGPAPRPLSEENEGLSEAP